MYTATHPELIGVAHLTLRRLPAAPSVDNPQQQPKHLVVVNNAYGLLPYVPHVADAMAQRGYDVWWFPFSGQDGTPGEYALPAAVDDLQRVIDHVKQAAQGDGVSLLAHCAGALVTTETFKQHGNPGIERLAFYGPLLNPARRRVKAEERLARCGVRHNLTEYEWHFPWLDNLPSVSTPTLFCHARDALNLDRATAEELASAVQATPQAESRWFPEGYDLRFDSIGEFADAYDEWFRQDPKLVSVDQGGSAPIVKGMP